MSVPSSSPPRPSNSGVAFAELDKERKNTFTSEAANTQGTFLKYKALETSKDLFVQK